MRVLMVLLALSLLGAPADRYASVQSNGDGSVTITTEDGRHISLPVLPPVPPDMKNVDASEAAVAPDHQSVGWLAYFENCCTSYPLPSVLVVFHDGRLHSLSGAAAIWFWRFQDGGKRVAAHEELPHGAEGEHYDLWDVASGKHVAEYRPEYDDRGQTVARPNEPEWVKALDAAEAKSR